MSNDEQTQDEQDVQEQLENARTAANSAGGPSLASEVTQADSNPAFYPKEAKSEALHGEAEKAGFGYPGPILPEHEGKDPEDVLDPAVDDHADDADADADAGDDKPAGNASTDDWRAYAVSQGMSQEEADQYSRDELVEYYS